MKFLFFAILGSLASAPDAFGFQPSFRGVPSRTIQSPTQLFLADQIKDYKKGLSKINGLGSSDTVSCMRPDYDSTCNFHF